MLCTWKTSEKNPLNMLRHMIIMTRCYSLRTFLGNYHLSSANTGKKIILNYPCVLCAIVMWFVWTFFMKRIKIIILVISHLCLFSVVLINVIIDVWCVIYVRITILICITIRISNGVSQFLYIFSFPVQMNTDCGEDLMTHYFLQAAKRSIYTCTYGKQIEKSQFI